MTGQDAIIDQILSLLRTALPGVRVAEAIEFDAMQEAEGLAIEVTLLQSTPVQLYAGAGAVRTWENKIRITCGARKDARAQGQGRASMGLLAQVDAALLADATLGFLTTPLQLADTRPDLARADTAIGVIDALYTCAHETAWNSLELS